MSATDSAEQFRENIASFSDIMPSLAALAQPDQDRVPYDFLSDAYVHNLSYGTSLPAIISYVVESGAGINAERIKDYLDTFDLANEQTLTDPEHPPELPNEDEIPEDALIRMLFSSFSEAVYELRGSMFKDRLRGAFYMGLLTVDHALKHLPQQNDDNGDTPEADPLRHAV